MVGPRAGGHAGAVVSLDDVVDDLYGGPLEDFVARRDAAVRAARAAQDRDLARRIGALRKPTLAAAAVNLLVRDDPTLAGTLRDLGESLRDAAALVAAATGLPRKQVYARALAMRDEG